MTQGGGTGAVNGRSDGEVTIVVDGANVVGSRPDGWWRDRAGAAVRLHDNLAKLAERGHQGIPAGELATIEPAPTPNRRADNHEDDHEQAGTPQAGREHEDASLVPVTVLLVLEGAARAAVPRIAERARAASGVRATAGAGEVSGDGDVRVVSAPGSGDDEIVRQAQQRAGHCIVVTADRELRRRCVAAGARVAGPSWLYGLL
jgi:cell wall-associated NlpC family hydrolase